MKTTQLLSFIENKGADKDLIRIYGEENLSYQRERYVGAVKEFYENYGECEVSVFSVPGRSELSGNHTDHNHGR